MVHSGHVTRALDLLLGIPALPGQRLPRVLPAKCRGEVAVLRIWTPGGKARRRAVSLPQFSPAPSPPAPSPMGSLWTRHPGGWTRQVGRHRLGQETRTPPAQTRPSPGTPLCADRVYRRTEHRHTDLACIVAEKPARLRASVPRGMTLDKTEMR